MRSPICLATKSHRTPTGLLKGAIDRLYRTKTRDVISALLLVGALALPLSTLIHAAAPAPKDAVGSPSDTFSILLQGTYRPVVRGPNLGLSQVNLSDGSFSTVKIYPISGLPEQEKGHGNRANRSGDRDTEDPIGNLRFFVLPSLTLALAEWPGIMRILRSDMIATLQEDYIALAKAKGLTPARILFVHALKPSSLTLVTITGINIGRLIGGAVIVETVFALPGIGRLLVGAIGTRDLIILQGVVLLVAAGFVIMNFIVDLLYAVLDPRIRHGHA